MARKISGGIVKILVETVLYQPEAALNVIKEVQK
jgi:hypothetical protein